MEVTLNIKPLSVNKLFQGRRFRTKEYDVYEMMMRVELNKKKYVMPPPPYEFHVEFGFSNTASDLDNPIKSLVDICQAYYGFNDKEIFRIVAEKKIVPKGKEYITFEFETYE